MYIPPTRERFTHSVVAALLILICAACANADLSDPGPWPAGWTSVTVTRASGTTFTARLFYPATSAALNAPFDPSGGQYPAISFGHGFLQAVSQYQTTCAHLASHGYVVIASDSEGSISPSHSNFASDLSRSLTFLEQENVRASSPYFGHINITAMGMSGHSMGGGASILAAAVDPRVKALANMAAAETNPSAIAAAANLRIPVRFICGSADTIVPVAGNGQMMFAAAPSPKQLPLIAGGFHCGFTDATFLFCDSGSISRAAQLASTRALLTAFFDLYLKSDQSRWSAVWGPGAPPPTQGGPSVALSSTPGITMLPAAQPALASLGADALVTITLTNTGPITATFTISSEPACAPSASCWSATVSPIQTLPLSPGASTTLTASVRAPALSGPPNAAITLSARSDLDGGTRAYATVAASRTPCPADWNGIDGLTPPDIFAFLAAWFAADPRADFNGVNGITVQDIFDFLAAWFAGCP